MISTGEELVKGTNFMISFYTLLFPA